MNHDKTNQSMSDEWIGKSARIKGESPYFLKKYGTSNPVIARLETDVDALGCSWMVAQGNPAALIFARSSTRRRAAQPADETPLRKVARELLRLHGDYRVSQAEVRDAFNALRELLVLCLGASCFASECHVRIEINPTTQPSVTK